MEQILLAEASPQIALKTLNWPGIEVSHMSLLIPLNTELLNLLTHRKASPNLLVCKEIEAKSLRKSVKTKNRSLNLNLKIGTK